MVRNGQRPRARPLPVAWKPAHAADDVEVLRLSWLRERVPHGAFERPEFHILVLYTRGRTRHEVDFASHACGPGILVRIAPGQVHRFSLGEGIDGLALVFHPTIFSPAQPRGAKTLPASFFDDVGWPTALRLDAARRQNATRLLERLRALIAHRTSSTLRLPLLQHALAATLLEIAYLAGLAPAALPGDAEDAGRARAFREATERSYRVTRSVMEYAQALSCSSRTLDRVARRAFGVSAKAFIDARVVLEARRMLAHTGESVAAIAEHLGFSEPTNFVKFYRARTGQAPGDFRRARQTAIGAKA